MTTSNADPEGLAAALASCLAGCSASECPSAQGEALARQAEALAVQLRQPLDQARAAAWLCTHVQRQGRHADLLAEAARVLPLLADPALAPERRELLRLVTVSGADLGAFDRALDAAHELSRLSRDADDPQAALGAAFSLAVCLERMGDSWQAERLLREALDSYGHGAPTRPLLVAANGVCAMAIGMAHRLRGAGAEAELQETLRNGRRQGELALSLLELLPDTVYEVAVKGNLGEIRLLQGEAEAAGPLLQHALALAEAGGIAAHAWRLRTSLADWRLAGGDAAGALQEAQALLALMAGQGPPQTTVRAHDSAYRAARALGRHAEALHHLETAERLDRIRTTSQLRAQSQLFVTRSEAQRAREQAESAHADALRQRERAAEYAAAAERDPLTGLGNRRHLHRRCADLLPQAARDGQPLSLAVLDLDHFKQVNDRHGHAVGDRVLVALAQILRDNTRVADVLVRHGGEEFVVVLPGLGPDRSAEIVERLRQRVEAHPWAQSCGALDGITVSIGLNSAPPLELALLLQGADEALYAAKHGGRNRLAVHAG